MNVPKATQCASTATIYACRKVAKTFSENIYELSRVRKEWTPEYAADLKQKIEQTLKKHFDNRTLKGNLPDQWEEIPVAVIRDLSLLRAEVKVDFKMDKLYQKQIFHDLGYEEFFSDAKDGDYMSLFYLLCTFRKRMDGDMKASICRNGIEPALIDRIIDFSNQITQNTDCVEWFKRRELVNTLAEKEVTQIHNEIKNICRIASSYYMMEPVKREKFCFYKVLRNMNN